jgi:hypothetical protein
MSDQERVWLNNATYRGGSFVSNFAKACFCADGANFQLLRPILAAMMVKYPTYSKDEYGVPA